MRENLAFACFGALVLERWFWSVFFGALVLEDAGGGNRKLLGF